MNLRLTQGERDAAEWAMDPMLDLFEPGRVPTLDGDTLKLDPNDDEVVEDLLYRLEEQMEDMHGSAVRDGDAQGAEIRPYRTLAAKLRKATGR